MPKQERGTYEMATWKDMVEWFEEANKALAVKVGDVRAADRRAKLVRNRLTWLHDCVAWARNALQTHKHMEQCRQYSARTARQHGNAYCISVCADSREHFMAKFDEKVCEVSLGDKEGEEQKCR